jgi:hypothetical protein
MNFKKIPAVALAAALQILPMCRVACVNQAIAPSGFAIVTPWLAGSAVLLGSYHAVSGASAAISGVALWTQITNGVQNGPVCPPSIATGTVGQSLLYKVILSNPGTQNTEFDYYNYDVLPPGLTMTTNVGGTDGIGNEFITGSPSQAGTYTVNLVAGNLNWPQSVTKAFTITISGGSVTRPGITTPPKSQTVTEGTNVTFTVTATGTPPLSYLWKFNSTAIASATNSSYQVSNVQTTNSGTYSVTVTNSAGSTNVSATLTVLLPPSIQTPLHDLTVTNGMDANFTVVAGGSAPLTYFWKFNGGPLASTTSSSLTITNAQTGNQGDYTVVVSNIVGTISSAAHLTVQEAVASPLMLANLQSATGSWSFDVTGPVLTNYVLWSSTDLSNWFSLKTNFSATGSVHFIDSNAPAAVKFYRATLSP